MKVATCSIVKLENNYLVEFVNHYKKIGVDHMYIYDNNDETDEHPEEVLQKYIDENFVTIIDFRNQEKYPMGEALKIAFNDCWENNKNEYDWILFLDNDEFLELTKDKNIKEYLSRDIFNNVDVIQINWKCYDDNNLIYYDDRPMQERFTHVCNDDPYTFNENLHIKSIVHNTAKNKKLVFKENSPAHCPYLQDDNIIVCDNKGSYVYKEIYNNHKIDYIDYTLAYYKHYRMKTIDEYINNKIKKLNDKGYKNLFFTSNKFFEYNKYDEQKEKLYIDNIYKFSRNCVYTCIIGDYDNLHDPLYVTEGWDYICLTNNHNIKSDIWKIIYIDDEINSYDIFNDKSKEKHINNFDRFINRFYKIHLHSIIKNNYDFSIYIDGNITIYGDLNEFKEKYIDTIGSYKYIMWTASHYRDCIYDEIDACIKQNKDDIDKLNKLKQFYYDNNMPKHYGMTHNCFIARYHLDQKCSRLMWHWFDMIDKYCIRDQCSLLYLLWKYDMKDNVCSIDNNVLNNYINYYEAYGKHKN